MRRILLFFMVFSFVASSSLFAQERTISGKIISEEDGQPVPGANVVLKGTTIGTVSDINGDFKLTVPGSGGTLVVTFIGYTSQEYEIGSQSVFNVSLLSDVQQLSEVVVTAVGIERDKKALGYSVQELDGQEIAQSKDVNFVNSLSGKIAGVQVTNTSGAVGGSSRIVIRGASSFGGNNQPLFIVDGIPINNSQFSSKNGSTGSTGARRQNNADFQSTVDYGNAAMDLNPEDIESMSVLKGPTAVALYGSRAQNGAIVITTKKGGSGQGIGIDFNTTTTFEKPLVFPEFQNEFGQGGYGAIGLGGSTSYTGVDESWGQPLDQGITVTDYLGRTVPLVSRPNNVEDFYETGKTLTNNIALSGGNDIASFRLSFSNLNQDGVLPNTAYKKNNVGINASSNLTDKLSISTTINYIKSEGDNRPGQGYSGQNPNQQLFNWFGRQVDVAELANYKDANGDNLLNPATGLQYNWNEVYHNNPYWILFENTNEDARTRMIGNFRVNYDVLDWLSASVRVGTDFYNDTRKQIYALGSIDPSDMGQGGFEEDEIFAQTNNADFILTATKNWSDDISTTLMAGYNIFTQEFKSDFVRVAGLLVPNVYNTANAAGQIQNTNSVQDKRIDGVYFSASGAWKNLVFLEVTGRNDWSSTLPRDNRSYFYPSVNASFVFSDAFEVPFIDFGKIRAGFAKVGNDTDPYQLQTFFVAPNPTYVTGSILFPFQGVPSFTVGDALANSGLRPEETTSFEIGADLRFLDNRLGIDFTYYNSNTVDQLVNVPPSTASGATSIVLNAGEIQNNGVEIMLNATPLRMSNGLEWNTQINFTKNNSEVVSIHPDVDNITLAAHFARVELREGEPYGSIVGTRRSRDANGNVIIGADGTPDVDPGTHIIGTVAPDFLMGWNNQFTYKGFSLGFLFDWKEGGDIHSVTNWFGGYSGVLIETNGRGEFHEGELSQANGRGQFDASGNLIPGTGIIVAGVNASDGLPNTTEIDAETYYHDTFSARDRGVFDASYIKLRELTFGYTLPNSLLGNTPFKNVSISFIGRNMALLHSNIPHIDPEVSSYGTTNAQGLETNSNPSNRSMGFSLRFSL